MSTLKVCHQIIVLDGLYKILKMEFINKMEQKVTNYSLDTPPTVPQTTSRAPCQVRCNARLTSAKLGITRLRLSVSEPCCVLPCLSRTRRILSFTFRKDAWRTTDDGREEQFTAYQAVDTSRLQRLQEDLPLIVKVSSQRHSSKARLHLTVGELLDLLHQPSRLTVQLLANPGEARLSWKANKQGSDPAVMHGAAPESGADHDPLCGNDALEVDPPPCPSDKEPRDEGPGDNTLCGPSQEAEEAPWWCGGVANFVNRRTGRTITLPAHDQPWAAGSGAWSVPGAWTPADDGMDEHQGGDTAWCGKVVTFVNSTTNRRTFITLPAHDGPPAGSVWSPPGAWTPDDDHLDAEDLRLLATLGRSASSSWVKDGRRMTLPTLQDKPDLVQDNSSFLSHHTLQDLDPSPLPVFPFNTEDTPSPTNDNTPSPSHLPDLSPNNPFPPHLASPQLPDNTWQAAASQCPAPPRHSPTPAPGSRTRRRLETRWFEAVWLLLSLMLLWLWLAHYDEEEMIHQL